MNNGGNGCGQETEHNHEFRYAIIKVQVKYSRSPEEELGRFHKECR